MTMYLASMFGVITRFLLDKGEPVDDTDSLPSDSKCKNSLRVICSINHLCISVKLGSLLCI